MAATARSDDGRPAGPGWIAFAIGPGVLAGGKIARIATTVTGRRRPILTGADELPSPCPRT